MFGLALIGLVAGLTLISTRDRPTFAAYAERDPAPQSAATPPASQPAAPAPKPRTGKGKAKAKAKARRVGRPPRARARARRAPQPAAPSPSPPRQEGFRPARIFSWPPHAGASYYQVVFLQNGKAFYRTQTNNARLVLPQGVRFRAGSYRWTVRPAIASDLGVRLARPIVDSTFKVSGD
jgi:hypothetical protein